MYSIEFVAPFPFPTPLDIVPEYNTASRPFPLDSGSLLEVLFQFIAEYIPHGDFSVIKESNIRSNFTLPAGHEQDELPDVIVLRPVGQSVQELWPVSEAYLPIGQTWHVDSDVLPVTVEYLPTAQGVHNDVLPITEYLPATHNTHW
jgi:hypothetical protein